MRSGTVDIVFANEHELKSLYQTASLSAALDAVRKDSRLAAVTRSEKGSVILSAGETVEVTLVPERGDYRLRCSERYHSTMGAEGEIIVR